MKAIELSHTTQEPILAFTGLSPFAFVVVVSDETLTTTSPGKNWFITSYRVEPVSKGSLCRSSSRN